MPRQFAGRAAVLIVESDEPLIAVPIEEDGREAVRYFVEEGHTNQALCDRTTREALGVLGAWSDFDWDEMEEALDRIRHESIPTPPLEL